jgi:hypothetical protein
MATEVAPTKHKPVGANLFALVLYWIIMFGMLMLGSVYIWRLKSPLQNTSLWGEFIRLGIILDNNVWNVNARFGIYMATEVAPTEHKPVGRIYSLWYYIG